MSCTSTASGSAPAPPSPPAQAYTGYWRVGGDNLDGWPNQPQQQLRRHDRRRRHLPDGAEPAPGRRPLHRRAAARSTCPRAPADALRRGGLRLLARRSTGGSTRPPAPPLADASRPAPTASTPVASPSGAAADGRGRAPPPTFNGSDGTIAAAKHGRQPDRLLRGAVVQHHDHRGGKLIGFGTAERLSGNYDRHVYMHDDGQLTFGVWTGQANTHRRRPPPTTTASGTTWWPPRAPTA